VFAAASPLAFIFEHTAYHGMEGLTSKVVLQGGENWVSDPCVCLSISPDNCCKGQFIMCE